MNNFLNIQETTIDIGEGPLHKNQIKITNTSNQFINNLKLCIDTNTLPLVEQTIIRDRGALCYSENSHMLELGNLAPDETALFEYQYKTGSEQLEHSLLSHIHFSYIPEDTPHEVVEHPIENPHILE